MPEHFEIARETDPLYPQSCAYHEAGHTVVAAALGLRLSRHGIHLCSDGNAISYYEYRKPRRFSSAPSELKREDTIICSYAGLIAQRKFHPRCSGCGATDDENTADLLLVELAEEDPNPLGFLTSTLQIELWKKAEELVDLHWPAIEAVGRELWENKPVDADLDDPAPGWSECGSQRRISGVRIIEILRSFDFHTMLWDAKP
jgi:hypothetical protein